MLKRVFLLSQTILWIAVAILGLSSCTNLKIPTAVTSQTTLTQSVANPPTGDLYTIQNVTVGTSSLSLNGLAATLFFDVNQVPAPISQHCNPPSKACNCTFNWNETNSATATVVARSVTTVAVQSQPTQLTCPVPDDYASSPSRIVDGTTIHVNLVKGAGNADTFSVSQDFLLKKTSSLVAGSFQDAQGHFFDNILRYSCYERFKRGMSVNSRTADVSNPTAGTTETLHVPFATSFCLAKGASASSANCLGLAPPANSSQANYFNLYIRDSERGDINTGNDRYVCPMVQEPLIPTTGGTANGGQFYPLDSSFALSLGQTTTFTIGVESYSKTSNGSDPVSSNSGGCFAAATSSAGSAGGTADTTSLIKSCLGFAAPPNVNGSCPSFQTYQGSTLVTTQTYRLRRYIAIYPRVYDVDGRPFVASGQSASPQASDTVYVVDRPVTGPSGAIYTMLGPKPCPAAYYDTQISRLNTTSAACVPKPIAPGYGSTNDVCWTGVNVDGIQFPYQDIYDTTNGVYWCSAEIPEILPSGALALTMINGANAPGKRFKYIRPIQPWAPHYEEDLSFKACAPLANPLRDPPIHLALNGANTSYCAEVYPSQNSNPAALDTHLVNGVPTALAAGTVVPFTSHQSKNSTSAACAFTRVPLAPAPIYGGAGTAPNHPVGAVAGTGITNMSQTCDRTVITTSLDWMNFPLLAFPSDVENALTNANDTSYNCQITYDNGGVKSANLKSPAGGCCGAAISGYPAHLEPPANPSTTLGCQVPAY